MPASRPVFLDSILIAWRCTRKNPRAERQDQKQRCSTPPFIVIATVVVAIIMWFVIPSFKQVFTSFGADLPWLTNVVVSQCPTGL